jgi:putative transposase
MARRKDPVIPDAILDQLLAGADAKTAFDQNGLLDQLKKSLTERALKAGLDHHLAGDESGNRRNGYGHKTVLTDGGSMGLSIPRDRTGTFDPALIGKYQRRFPGFNEKIISLSPLPRQRLPGKGCTHAACRRARSRDTCGNSMALRSRPI